MTLADLASSPPGDVDALVTAHMPLARYAVSSVAARVQFPPHVSRDDLLSCAQVALVEVAQRYQPGFGASFATYALPRLQGAVLDELRAADWASRRVRSEARRAQSATDALLDATGRQPTETELAEYLGISPADLNLLRSDVQRAAVVSMDEAGVADRVRADETTPENHLLDRERTAHLIAAVEALPPRLAEVVQRHFFAEESLTAIAGDFGVTVSRVSQMRAEAVRLMRSALATALDGADPALCSGGRTERRYISDMVARTSNRAGVLI